MPEAGGGRAEEEPDQELPRQRVRRPPDAQEAVSFEPWKSGCSSSGRVSADYTNLSHLNSNPSEN